MFAILFLSLTLLQNAFDNGDRRRALALLDIARPDPKGPSIMEILTGLNHGQPPPCTALVPSACASCRGITRVECEVGGEKERYVFAADLITRTLKPASEATVKRFGAPIHAPDEPPDPDAR
jgi:hypothetical protein